MQLRARFLHAVILCGVLLALVNAPRDAHAQMIIKDPHPPQYSVELEGKLNIDPETLYGYGGTGIGPGVRASIPLVSPGFIPNLNNSIAISFGLDILRHSGYAYYGRCDAAGCYRYDGGGFWSVYFPVAMQWNFFLTKQFSVFAEPGLALRHAFINDSYCDARFYACGSRDDLYLTLFAGGRFMITDRIAITARVGHPILLSAGISIFL